MPMTFSASLGRAARLGDAARRATGRCCPAPLLPFLPLTAGLVACGGSEHHDELRLDQIDRVAVIEELRLGSVDDPEIGFSRIGSMDVDRDGRAYVLEVQDMQVRVYSSEGRPLHRIGRRGDGPGEFRGVGRLGVVGDTLWTFDYVGERITLFDRDGTLLSTGRADAPPIPLWNRCYGYVMPSDMRPDGLFTSRFSRVACSRDEPAPEKAATEPVPVPRVLFDATGAVVDTVGWDDRPPPRMARPPGATNEAPPPLEIGGVAYLVPRPPPELPIWLHLPDGRIELSVPIPTSADASFTVTRIGASGDTTFVRRFLYEATRYTAEELDALAAEAAASPFAPPGTATDPAAEARLRAAMEFPDFRPVTQVAQLDSDGRIWMLRGGPNDRSARWIVLDTDGLPLGELEFPSGFSFRWSGGDVVWGVETDDLDVPWLVRYRMEIG